MGQPDDLIPRLIQADVEFVVVGGLAAAFHGATLVTQDMDICCEFSVGNLMRLQAAIADLHPVHRMPPAHPPLTLKPDCCQGLKNLYLDSDYGQLDCLGSIAGVGDFAEVKRNSIELELPAGVCRVLSLDALIRSKEALDQPRDREALRQLKAIRERLEQE